MSLVREEIFTFTAPGAPDVVIRSGALRAWLLERCMDKVIELTFPKQPLAEIVKMHGLERPRMKSMTHREAQEPVIVGIMDNGTNILIDGGHRRWYWARRGKNVLKGWAVPPPVWQAFTFDPNGPGVICNHPDGSMLPQRRARA